jgi:ABC-2 type transport system permease protein
MAGNSFGSDGPPLTHELLTGADIGDLVAGKARGVAVVAAPLAVVGPLIAAAVTDEWRYLPAGFGIGAGAVLAGTGAAIVQSALVPIAIPESDNPFAGGESGKGILAAVLLLGVLVALGTATVPVALALLWAVEEQHTVFVGSGPASRSPPPESAAPSPSSSVPSPRPADRRRNTGVAGPRRATLRW